jgi:hypothetical protein
LQDAAELTKKEGAMGIPMSLPGLFGIGMQTYDVDLGYDALGRDIEELLKKGEDESNPVAIEIQRLSKEADNDFNGMPTAPKSFKDEGVKYELTEEQTKEWQRVMGEYTAQYLQEDMNSEDYLLGDDTEKIAIIRAAHRDAFADTKVYFEDNVLTTKGE